MVTLPPAAARLRGIGGDDVVGLPALHLDRGDVVGAGGGAGQRELRHQLLGRRRPVRLVLGVDLVAEGLARIIEDHRHVGRRVVALQVLGQLEQHVAEADDAADRQPVGLARQLRQGVKGAENVARAVDEKQMHE